MLGDGWLARLPLSRHRLLSPPVGVEWLRLPGAHVCELMMLELGEIAVTECRPKVYVLTERVQWDVPDDELLVYLGTYEHKRDAIAYAARLQRTFGKIEECST